MLALQRWPLHRRKFSALGLLLMTSLVGASFATRVDHLVWTQGFLYGVGGSLLYSPFIFYLDEWFVKRKGLAYGVAWAGTSFGGSVIPLLMEWGLQNYGFQLTLRAWALFVVGPPVGFWQTFSIKQRALTWMSRWSNSSSCRCWSIALGRGFHRRMNMWFIRWT